MIIYGLHSLRSGGITSAVRNSSNSIPERLLKIHGRWKSDSAKDMYVEESLENRLQAREGDSHMKQTDDLRSFERSELERNLSYECTYVYP